MLLVLLRLSLLLTAALLSAGLLAASLGLELGPSLLPQFSALYFIPVNLLCLWLLRRRLHAAGSSLRQLAGFEPSRLGRDLLAGLLWQIVLFVPFALGINLVMLLVFGTADYGGSFERVFAGNYEAAAAVPAWFSMASAVLVGLLFPISNAPTEELYYRGHAQGRLLAAGAPTWLALLLPSVAFGVQHVFLAPTAVGALVYFGAFLLWGLGAAIIRLRTGRLMPLIVAHFFTNAITAVVPLVLVFTLQ